MLKACTTPRFPVVVLVTVSPQHVGVVESAADSDILLDWGAFSGWKRASFYVFSLSTTEISLLEIDEEVDVGGYKDPGSILGLIEGTVTVDAQSNTVFCLT